ncbi:MAG TPA: hypothetical protein PLS49_04245 [Candidatus Woesebacteria bacterium]|nr:hypothetical protein [Candidatus Woesebacteria bacterium]
MDTQQLYAEFWKWFLEKEDQFFHYERQDSELLDITLEKLKIIHPDLVFEISPEYEGKREFIISANGLKEAFTSVIELANQAPEMDRWSIIPFRQRKQDLDIEIEVEDMVLSPEDIFFTHETSGNKISIDLYIAGIDIEDERVFHIILLLLDNVVGEYDVEMKLDQIDIHPLTDVEDATKLYALKELPFIVDHHFNRKVD